MKERKDYIIEQDIKNNSWLVKKKDDDNNVYGNFTCVNQAIRYVNKRLLWINFFNAPISKKVEAISVITGFLLVILKILYKIAILGCNHYFSLPAKFDSINLLDFSTQILAFCGFILFAVFTNYICYLCTKKTKDIFFYMLMLFLCVLLSVGLIIFCNLYSLGIFKKIIFVIVFTFYFYSFLFNFGFLLALTSKDGSKIKEANDKVVTRFSHCVQKWSKIVRAFIDVLLLGFLIISIFYLGQTIGESKRTFSTINDTEYIVLAETDTYYVCAIYQQVTDDAIKIYTHKRKNIPKDNVLLTLNKYEKVQIIKDSQKEIKSSTNSISAPPQEPKND